MGHHHVHPYLAQTLAFGFAALPPAAALLLLAGGWWESYRRRHGHRTKPGSRRAVISARFAADLE